MIKSVMNKLLVSTVLLGSVTGITLAHEHQAHASDKCFVDHKLGVFNQMNDSEATLTLSKNYSYKVNANGTAVITNLKTGTHENLPSEGKDKNGKLVTLSYINNGNALKLIVIDKSTEVENYVPKHNSKCDLGTKKDVTITILKNASSKVSSIVSSDMVGADASCFEPLF